MNKKYKQNFLKAGSLAREVRAFGKSLIVKGASYNEVIRKINAKIYELGAIPAFPPQIALNQVAAHYLPMPNEDLLFNDQVIKLDVGVCFEGAIGDCAVTIDLSGHHQHIIDAAELALKNAEQIIKVGLPVSEIGRVIEDTIVSLGLQPIRNLGGHGLGIFKVHTSPLIPNYNDRSKAVVKPGMTFAIEPFATNGKGLIYEQGFPTIYSFVRLRPLKTEAAKKLIPTLKTLGQLPFSIHNLVSNEHPYEMVIQGVNELLFEGVIEGYPPLIEEAGGMVAQAENSVLIDEDGIVTISTR